MSQNWITAAISIFMLSILACSSPPVTESAIASAQSSPQRTKMTATASVKITEVSDTLPIAKIVAIFPSNVVVDLGEEVQLSANVSTEDGRIVDDAEIIWAMADPRAGSISDNGNFRAGATPGIFPDAISATAIQNTNDGIRYTNSTSSVSVIGDAETSMLSELIVLPEPSSVVTGQIYRMTAIGFDQNGRIIQGVGFSWSVDNSELGHITQTGFLTVEGAAGSYEKAITISGDWQGVRLQHILDVGVIDTPKEDDFFRVQILPQSFHLDAGERLQLRAIALNGLGEILDSAEMRWELVEPGIGAVDASGTFIAGDEPGIYTEAVRVEAAIPGGGAIQRAEDFASVVIREAERIRPVSRVIVFPGEVAMHEGSRSLLVAHPVDESGNLAGETEIAWEMSDPLLGDIDNHGNFIATAAPGYYENAIRVTASQTFDGQLFTIIEEIDLTLTGTLSRAEIQPQLPTIAPGRSVHFDAKGWDENGVEIKGLVTLWEVTDTSAGEIDIFGNFIASENPGLFEGVIQAQVIQNPD